MPQFKRIPNKISFPEQEKTILKFWQEQNIFEASLNARKDKPRYVFYDGPPFATGLPHYGHLLAGIIKDIVPRYHAMQGKYVERRFGWDCHGLPVEMEMQKQLKLKTSKDIQAFGIAEFNRECKSIVLRYTAQWQETVERIGRWVDFKNDYKTMDRNFMESIWWVFKQIYDKGLIYKGFKVVPYSWKATTILSNFEAKLNYQTVQDPAIIVKFPVSGKHKESILAWTTTPWTLVGNLAIAVNPDLCYVKAQFNNETYILAESCLQHAFGDKTYKVVSTFPGSKLSGMRYEAPFSYAATALAADVKLKNAFQVLPADFVGATEGVGIVHCAPAYGEDDFELCQKHELPHYDPIDADGFFSEDIAVARKSLFNAAVPAIIKELKQRGRLFQHRTIKHSYPYCWRTDTPLIYKAISTWFVNVEAIKDQLCANNESIHWVPGHIKTGRFGSWLSEAKDWAISRNRYWGTPIPIWEAADGERICVGSIEELRELSGTAPEDLHKPGIDELTITRNGKIFRRVSEVLDCWFESGSMPYAHKHYPFENKKAFEAGFPADFIAEGLDQTRGWFYTLLVIATSLFGKSSFKNVVVSGLILAKDGKKMSKRLKNYPAPAAILDQYGADALRAYLISSAVLKGETLRFSEQGILRVMRNLMLPLWNALSFFCTYANMDNWQAPADRSWLRDDPAKLVHPLDRWILSTRETLLDELKTAMDSYELYKAVPPLSNFIDKLTNIYIRRSRERFWKRSQHQTDIEKAAAYQTLYSTLKHFSVILAPFMPFLAEAIYDALKTPADKSSVHLEDYPTPHPALRDKTLEQALTLVNELITLGRNARIAAKLRIRQPVGELTFISSNRQVEPLLKRYSSMIREELNVKILSFSSDENRYLSYSAKADFKILGKQYNKTIKAINVALMALSSKEIVKARELGHFTLSIAGKSYELPATAVRVHRSLAKDSSLHNHGELSCILHTALSPQLELEGLAREVIHTIQNLRKENALEYNDSIELSLYCNEALVTALANHKQTISEQTLAHTLQFHPLPSTATKELSTVTLLGHRFMVKLNKHTPVATPSS